MPEEKKPLEEELKKLGQEKDSHSTREKPEEERPRLEEELKKLGKAAMSFAEDKPPVIGLDYIIEAVCKEDPDTNPAKAEELIHEKLEPHEIVRIPGFGGYFVHRDAGIWFLYAYRYSLKQKNQSGKEIALPETVEELPSLVHLKYTVDQACENNGSDSDKVKKLLREKVRPGEILDNYFGMGSMVHQDAAAWFIYSYKRSLKLGDKAWKLFSLNPILEKGLIGLEAEDSEEEPNPYELTEEPAQENCSVEGLKEAMEKDNTYSKIFPFCSNYSRKCSQHARDMIHVFYTMAKPETAAKFGEKALEISKKAEEYRSCYLSLQREFGKIKEEIDRYEEPLRTVLTEAESEAEKRFIKGKAEESIELAKRLDELNSQANGWLTSLINQDWGIGLGTKYERKITLQQFLTKVEEAAQNQD